MQTHAGCDLTQEQQGMMCLACKGAQNHALSHTVKNQLMLSKMPLSLEPLLVVSRDPSLSTSLAYYCH